ncbi:ATP-binding protein [Streptomyces sp. NPDC053367]|uniref:ATP-binding protein n=1 Tax=Streptomyces sp. NPDC053367 TaxID=3365700 RepID=UPI0037CF87A7
MTSTTVKVAVAHSAADQETVLGFDVSFLPDDVRVPQMRRLTRAHLRLWQALHLSDAADVLVSELVTNAIQHGGGHPVRLKETYTHGKLHIEVTDGNPQPPRPRRPDAAEESGRGLLLVAALASQWGVSPDGTTTWCSLSHDKGSPSMEPVAGFTHEAAAHTAFDVHGRSTP